jgi:SAM-dependent methyltransferase
VFADDPSRAGGDGTGHGQLVEVLADMLDSFTVRRLAPYVSRRSRCLEVGAGAGSIAVWLAEHASEVTATDTDPRQVLAHPHLRVIRHDITTDPLRPGGYDLIHTRLLLAHLPQRRELVGKLVDALAPGGVLVIEEFQPGWDWCVLDAPDMAEARRLFTTYHRALTSVLAAAGNDTGWGRAVPRVMRQHRLLREVDVELWARSWYGGQPGCRLPYLAAAQLRPKLIDAGMTTADIDAFRDLLLEPELMIHANLTVSTIARRSTSSAVSGSDSSG